MMGDEDYGAWKAARRTAPGAEALLMRARSRAGAIERRRPPRAASWIRPIGIAGLLGLGAARGAALLLALFS